MALRATTLPASNATDSTDNCTILNTGHDACVSDQVQVSTDNDLVAQGLWNIARRGADCYIKDEKLVSDNECLLSGLPPSLEQNQVKHHDAKRHVCKFMQLNYGGLSDMVEEEHKFPESNQCSKCSVMHNFTTVHSNSNQFDHCPEKQDSTLYLNTEITKANCSQRHAGLEKSKNTKELKNQCPTCLKCFSAPSKLRRHILIHTNQRPFGCQLCPKTFRQLIHLKLHLNTHFSQKPHKVKDNLQNVPSVSSPQGLSFGTSLNTLVYSSRYSMEQWAEGNRAPEVDPTLSSLPDEAKEKGTVNVDLFPNEGKMEKLNGIQNFNRNRIVHECPVCLKCFSAPSKLRRHCLIHTGQRPFQCSVCNRGFRQLSHLKAHHIVHSHPRKIRTSLLQQCKFTCQPQHSIRASKIKLKHFLCNNFSRCLRSAKHLPVQKCKKNCTVEHRTAPCPTSKMATDQHTVCVKKSTDQYVSNRQGYHCTVCSKYFSAPSKLKRHLLVHTGQRSFRCPLCFRTFTQRSHLKVHRCKGQSSGSSNTSQNEVQLKEKSSYDTHFSGPKPSITVSDDHLICCNTVVNEMSSSNTAGIGDIKSDSHLAIQSKNMTNDHFRAPDLTNTAKPRHQCTLCFKKFDFHSKLSRHLLIHMDIKPFTCNICSRSFRQLCHLKSHLIVHTRRKSLHRGDYITTTKTSAVPEKFENVNVTNKARKRTRCVRSYNSKNLQLILSNKKTFHSNSSSKDFSVLCTLKRQTLNLTLPTTLVADRVCTQEKRNGKQCTICLKTFDFPSKLSRHMLIHTGIRPHKCHTCHKSFRQLSHLRCHQWLHQKTDRAVNTVNMPRNQSCASLPHVNSSGPPEVKPDSFNMVSHGHDLNSDFLRLQRCARCKESDLCDECCESSASSPGRADCKVKSEFGLQGDRSDHPALKYKLDNSVTGAVETSRIPVLNGQDQPLMLSSEASQLQHRAENRQGIPIGAPENSVSVYDSFHLSDEKQETSESSNCKEEADVAQRLSAPPNDLPICPSCSSCFTTVNDLQAHRCLAQAHQDTCKKAYLCAICFKSFKAPSKLKRHYVIHTGERPFQCSVCGRAFTQLAHLKTHILAHS